VRECEGTKVRGCVGAWVRGGWVRGCGRRGCGSSTEIELRPTGCPSPGPSPFVPHGEGRIRSRTTDIPAVLPPPRSLAQFVGEGRGRGAPAGAVQSRRGRGPRRKRVTRSPVHPFTRSPVHPFTRSPVHPFTRSPVHPFTRSPVHPFTLSLFQAVRFSPKKQPHPTSPGSFRGRWASGARPEGASRVARRLTVSAQPVPPRPQAVRRAPAGWRRAPGAGGRGRSRGRPPAPRRRC
jgi:hypothetical protein